MAQRTVDIRLGTKYNGSGIAALKKGLASVGRNLVNFQAGCSRAASAIGKLGSIFSGSFKFETQTAQFKTLIGNIDEARAHMADLKALGDSTPFSLDQFAAASLSLRVMTDGALGYKKSLEMIGDAAAATGRPIEEMGQAVGRLYSFIRDGQPLSRAVMQLRNMGVITPEVAQKLQDMQAAGKSSVEIWAEVEAQLGRYNGAMKEAEQTGDGLIAAIKGQWNNTVRSLGDAFSDVAKDSLSLVLEKLKALNEDGSLTLWAQKAVDAFNAVKEGAEPVVGVLSKVASAAWNTIEGFYQSNMQALGNAVGTIAGGGGITDAVKSGWSGYKQGWVDAFDIDNAQSEQYERRKRHSAKRIAEEKSRV